MQTAAFHTAPCMDSWSDPQVTLLMFGLGRTLGDLTLGCYKTGQQIKKKEKENRIAIENKFYLGVFLFIQGLTPEPVGLGRQKIKRSNCVSPAFCTAGVFFFCFLSQFNRLPNSRPLRPCKCALKRTRARNRAACLRGETVDITKSGRKRSRPWMQGP